MTNAKDALEWYKRKEAEKMAQELEPCPFCGGEAKSLYVGIQKRIYCVDCGASILGGVYATNPEEEAIEKWNRRHKRTCHKVPGRMHYGERRPKCSECGYSLGDSRWYFCPKCGAEICGAEVVDGD